MTLNTRNYFNSYLKIFDVILFFLGKQNIGIYKIKIKNSPNYLEFSVSRSPEIMVHLKKNGHGIG